MSIDATGRTIDLAFAFGRIVRRSMAGADRRVNSLQLHALGYLLEHPRVTMKELADHLRITSPSATSFVDRLAKLRCVTRAHDPHNRKLVRIAATPLGRRVFLAQLKRRKRIIASLLRRLPARDRSALQRILRSLIRSAETLARHSSP